MIKIKVIFEKKKGLYTISRNFLEDEIGERGRKNFRVSPFQS